MSLRNGIVASHGNSCLVFEKLPQQFPQQPVAKNLPANPGDNRFDPEDPEDPTCHGATKLVVVVMVV